MHVDYTYANILFQHIYKPNFISTETRIK